MPITKWWLTISVYQTILFCLWHEIIYHLTNTTRLSTPFRTYRENYCIRELGSTLPCVCGVNIKGVGNINSSENSDLIVMNLLNTNQPIDHSHDRSNYHRPKIKTKTFSLSGTSDDLISCIHKLLGSGCIRTTLFSLRVRSHKP